MTDKPKDDPAKIREVMDKIYAMTPEQVNQMLAENFRRMCSKPLPPDPQ